MIRTHFIWHQMAGDQADREIMDIQWVGIIHEILSLIKLLVHVKKDGEEKLILLGVNFWNLIIQEYN